MKENLFWDPASLAADAQDRMGPKALPNRLMISLTSRCNLRCKHCSSAYVDAERHDLPLSIVEYVCDEILPHMQYVRIGGNEWGEPLLSPQCNDFLARLQEYPHITSSLVTNLTCLNEEIAERISKSIDILSVSLEGSGEGYEHIRGTSWEQFLRNLRLLASVRDRQQDSSVRIQLIICVMRSNFKSIEKAVAVCAPYIDKVVLREFHPVMPEQEDDCLWKDPMQTYLFIKKIRAQARRRGIDCYCSFEKKYDSWLFHRKKIRSLLSAERCNFPWTTISIGSSGELSCCCKSLNIDILEDTARPFMHVWHGEGFQRLRASMQSGVLWDACKECTLEGRYSNEREMQALQKKEHPLRLFFVCAKGAFYMVRNVIAKIKR